MTSGSKSDVRRRREWSPSCTSLSAPAEEESRQNLLRYYEPMGPDIAETIAGNALRSPDAVRGAVQAYEAAGVDELILDPSVSDPAQVDRLAEVIFG